MNKELPIRIHIQLYQHLLLNDLIVDVEELDLFAMRARIANTDIWISWLKGTAPDEYHS